MLANKIAILVFTNQTPQIRELQFYSLTPFMLFIPARPKGSDLIRLVFPLNNGAPVASANFYSDGKVQVSPYLAIQL